LQDSSFKNNFDGIDNELFVSAWKELHGYKLISF